MSLLARLASLQAAGDRGVLFTVVEGAATGAKLLVLESGETLGSGVPEEASAQFDEIVRRGRNMLLTLDDGTRVFAEWYGPPPRLFVYGAVDTAEALCKGARLLGWTTIVGDARATFLTPERVPSADQLIAKWPEDAIAEVAPGPSDRDRGAHARRQVRRAGVDQRARDGGVLHRCARLPPQPGAASRAAARSRGRGGADRPDRRPVRPRHRRRHPGRDGALDPGGDSRNGEPASDTRQERREAFALAAAAAAEAKQRIHVETS